MRHHLFWVFSFPPDITVRTISSHFHQTIESELYLFISTRQYSWNYIFSFPPDNTVGTISFHFHQTIQSDLFLFISTRQYSQNYILSFPPDNTVRTISFHFHQTIQSELYLFIKYFFPRFPVTTPALMFSVFCFIIFLILIKC